MTNYTGRYRAMNMTHTRAQLCICVQVALLCLFVFCRRHMSHELYIPVTDDLHNTRRMHTSYTQMAYSALSRQFLLYVCHILHRAPFLFSLSLSCSHVVTNMYRRSSEVRSPQLPTFMPICHGKRFFESLEENEKKGMKLEEVNAGR